MQDNNSNPKYDSQGRPIKKKEKKIPELKKPINIVLIILVFFFVFVLEIDDLGSLEFLGSDIIYLLIGIFIFYSFFHRIYEMGKEGEDNSVEFEQINNNGLDSEEEIQTTYDKTELEDDGDDYDEKKADRIIEEANKNRNY